MPDLFNSSTGKVLLVQGATPGRLSNIDLETGQGTFANTDPNILITSIAISQQVRLALFNTLNEDLFIYHLGNDASKCVIQGMAVSTDICNNGQMSYTGASTVMRFYDAYKAIGPNFNKLPVKLIIPPMTLEGYIDGMTLQINSGSSEFGIAKFSLNMTVLPMDNKPS